ERSRGTSRNTDRPVGGAAESPSERATPMKRRMTPRARAGAWAFPFLALWLITCCASAASSASAVSPRVVYRSPSQGARYLRPETNVIFRFDRALDRSSLPAFAATGSSSGAHSGVTALADDGRTLLFRPDQPFAWAERVDVSLTSEASGVHEAL